MIRTAGHRGRPREASRTLGEQSPVTKHPPPTAVPRDTSAADAAPPSSQRRVCSSSTSWARGFRTLGFVRHHARLCQTLQTCQVASTPGQALMASAGNDSTLPSHRPRLLMARHKAGHQ